MDALKSVCLSAERWIAALFLSSSVSQRHQYAHNPLEVLVVAPMSVCVPSFSLAYTQIGSSGYRFVVQKVIQRVIQKVTLCTRRSATSTSCLLTGMKQVASYLH